MDCYRRFKTNFFDSNDLEIAFARATQGDEYKHNVETGLLEDLKSFQPLIELGVMHSQATFILYSNEALQKWNIGNYVYPHMDGVKEEEPFCGSVVVPIERYHNSMVRWFEGNAESDKYETLRTGRFLRNFDDYMACKMIDFYNFEDNQPVLFRVDVWHDVLIPFSGRFILRWLCKQGMNWDCLIHKMKPILDLDRLHVEINS